MRWLVADGIPKIGGYEKDYAAQPSLVMRVNDNMSCRIITANSIKYDAAGFLKFPRIYEV